MQHSSFGKVAACVAAMAVAAVSASPAGARGYKQDPHGMTGKNVCIGKMNEKNLAAGPARKAEWAKCMAAPEDYK